MIFIYSLYSYYQLLIKAHIFLCFNYVIQKYKFRYKIIVWSSNPYLSTYLANIANMYDHRRRQDIYQGSA